MPEAVQTNPRAFLTRLSYFEPLARYWELLREKGFVEEANRYKDKYRMVTSIDPDQREQAKQQAIGLIPQRS